MKITVRQADLLQETTDLLVLSVYESEALPESIANLIEADDFSGSAKQQLLVYTRGALPAKRLLLQGLGKAEKAKADHIRQAAAQAAQKARELKVSSYVSNLPSVNGLSPRQVAQAAGEGALLGLYRFLRYKTDSKEADQKDPESLTFLVSADAEEASAGAAAAEAIARGVAFARDLANSPPNEVNPAYLGDAALALGERLGLKVTVYGLEELKERGFGGLLAVGQGSASPPRFIIMEYGQAAEGTPTVVLVGKGITFDTGGISIKPAESMDNMKMDMGGAAAVFGAMQAVAELKLPLHVVGLVSSAENMPSGTAYRPGDVIKTLSGKTVEVLNTDAEGRIVLADALYYAQSYKPAGVVDLATLTGAIMVALGPHAIGAMGNSPELMARLVQAGEISSERVWELPLWDEYREMVRSDIADVRNTGGARFGGAITAAAFLDAFVGDMPWVHLDIAGTAWGGSKPYHAKGATGIGVRLLVQMLQDWSA